MSFRLNVVALATRSVFFSSKICIVGAIFSSLCTGSLALSSEEIQQHRKQSTQYSDPQQSSDFRLTHCDSLVRSSLTDLDGLSSEMAPPAPKHPYSQDSADTLVAIGLRVQEIEKTLVNVLAVSRSLTAFAEADRALHASVQTEVSGLRKIRESFKRSRGLDRADKKLAETLNRQQDLVKPHETLKNAFQYLSDWRMNTHNDLYLAEVYLELEALSRQSVASGRGASHHAKIMGIMGGIARFRDSVSSVGWQTTQLTLSRYSQLVGLLWGEQTLAVLDASKHTDYFSDFPLNQAIASEIENLRPSRGHLGRAPENELVIEKSIYGYDLLSIYGTLSGINRERLASSEIGGDYSESDLVRRKNLALLDPDLIVMGISRGTVLKDTRSRANKQQSWAVVGFFPNGDVLVQDLVPPGKRPKLKSIPLSRAQRMEIVGTSNINRMVLVGDFTFQPSDDQIEAGVVKKWTQISYEGLFARKQYSSRGKELRWKLFGTLLGGASCISGCLAAAVAGDGGTFAVGVGVSAVSAAGVALSNYLVKRFTRSHEYASGLVHPPSAMAKLPGSIDGSPLLRSDSLWIGSNSLTSEERQALGINDGERWLVSTSGQKISYSAL